MGLRPHIPLPRTLARGLPKPSSPSLQEEPKKNPRRTQEEPKKNPGRTHRNPRIPGHLRGTAASSRMRTHYARFDRVSRPIFGAAQRRGRPGVHRRADLGRQFPAYAGLFHGLPVDTRTALTAILALGTVAIVAALPPAWRASNLTPVEALRFER